MTHYIESWAGWLVVVLGAATTVLVLLRRAHRKAKSFVARGNNAIETLVGRDAILHPDTGRVLVPETPGLGQRLAHIEGAIVSLAETQRTVADLSGEVTELRREVVHVGKTLTQHLSESAQVWAQRAEEQTEMWKAMRAIAQSAPSVDGDVTPVAVIPITND